jgi:hypothetical protein
VLPNIRIQYRALLLIRPEFYNILFQNIMKKQVIRVFFLLVSVLFGCSVLAAQEIGWITAPAGLWFREWPGLDSKKILLLEYKEKVIILEQAGPEITINGARGRWTKIELLRMTDTGEPLQGWVFGAHLTKSETYFLSRMLKAFPEKYIQLEESSGSFHVARSPEGQTSSIALDINDKEHPRLIIDVEGIYAEYEIVAVSQKEEDEFIFELRCESDCQDKYLELKLEYCPQEIGVVKWSARNFSGFFTDQKYSNRFDK